MVSSPYLKDVLSFNAPITSCKIMVKTDLPLSKIFVVEQSSSFLTQAALFSLVAENRGMSFTLQNRKRNK